MYGPLVKAATILKQLKKPRPKPTPPPPGGGQQ